ncbi:GPI inositol-deacylase-like protein [Euroglyphus maynei]|uniref:GPI inositol-deacylase n=1 Tax=Euroglyphus maynei TaxID=6958 RepID=A0A1Y3B7D8_EURMA|nr:GPI inositol-deacylase-like protein [Euroglyphus maynei]
MERNVRKLFPNYHLYVYGEGQYAETLRLNEFNGQPIIFVPGNAGSHKQVRSLASVALLMMARKASHLNYFTIDYNEELSAFIGDKLERQTKFLYHSVRRVVELYKHVPNIRIILIGHSIVSSTILQPLTILIRIFSQTFKGGLLIRSLLTKDPFRSLLPRISIVLTLSTPNRHPVIGYSYQTVRFYERINSDFQRFRNTRLSDLNFISIGGSHQDMIVRPDLIRLNSSNPDDLSLLTTAIPDVWVSADHLCIVWCRQLMIKLNRMFFDLIDHDTLVFIESTDLRQKIINYHLLDRHFSKEYPPSLPPTNLSTLFVTTTRMEWIELKDRLVRLSFLKIVRPVNYIIRLKEREMTVIYLEGNLRPDTISIGNCKQAETYECIENKVYTVTSMTRLVPNFHSKWDRHVGRFDADEWLAQGFTHLIINLSPSQQSSRYAMIVDRFTKSIRQRTIEMPNPLQRWNPFGSKLVMAKLVSQEQLYYEWTIENFNHVWHSYWMVVQTTSCYQNDSTFNGFMHLTYPSSPELDEFIWPLQPNKNSQYQFSLSRHTNNEQGRPKIYLFLEPNCGFDFRVKFSFTGSIAQLLRHYFALIVPMTISVMILVLSIQFSNLCNRYTFSNADLARFKTFVKRDEFAGKCYQFQTVSELMVQRHYFAFCFVQIVPASLLALFIIQQ